MADWSDFRDLATDLTNDMGDTSVTISRAVDTYDADPSSSSWTGTGIFNPNRTVLRNGVFVKATTVTVPNSRTFTPTEGDTVTANGRTWTVTSSIDGGVGQPLYFELVLNR